MGSATPVPIEDSPQERASVALLGSAVGMSLVLGLMLLGGYHLVLRHLRHSPEANQATQILKRSSQLQRLLGDSPTYRLEAGEVKPDGSGATFSYSVEGKRGDASVELELTRRADGWHLASGTVETDEGVMPFEDH